MNKFLYTLEDLSMYLNFYFVYVSTNFINSFRGKSPFWQQLQANNDMITIYEAGVFK